MGGVQIQTRNLAEGLSRRGYKNIVFTKRIESCPTVQLINDVEIVRKGYPSTNRNMFLKLIGLVVNFYYLFVNRHRYQIIHLKAAYFELMIPCWLVKKLSNLKVVYALSTGDELFSVQGRRLLSIRRGLKRLVVGSFDALVTMSESMSKEAQQFGVAPSKLRHIINGVESNRFTPDSSKKIPGRVIFIGRIEEGKGLSALLKAWKVISQHTKNIHLCVAGPFISDDYASVLNSYIASNGLKDTVSFAGEIDYYSDDIVNYYQSAELFVLPSKREGMSGALMQAMSCGLPVISTRVGGAEDLVFEGVNGFLVGIDDEVGLANAIIDFFSMEENRRAELGKCSRHIIVEKFGQEKRIDQFVELFSSVSDQPGILFQVDGGIT